MEKLGYHKRDLLVSRVKDAQSSQTEAKEQFRSALERFTSVVAVDGGDLGKRYDQLSSELKRSEDKASKVRKRIASVEDVADALFDEWEDELDTYSNAGLRRKSEERLRNTKRRYAPMIKAMRRAETKMEPVLAAFRDQVLYLKHNLNARAMSYIENELASVETDIAALVREMESSIGEAERFVQSMG